MNGGIIPSLLLCATIGLLLSYASPRVAWAGVACLVASSVIALLLSPRTSLMDAIFIALWLSIILTAALTYLPQGMARRWAIPLATVGGLWVGSLASMSGRKSDLALALPASLLWLPGRWIVARGYGLGVRIVASWMIAIASLSLFVSLTPTPGYKPDHME